MTHTPGPWKIKGQDIIGSGPNGYICTWSGRSANARLIAAAPEMLAMLEDILIYGDFDPNKIEPLIKKARGQE